MKSVTTMFNELDNRFKTTLDGLPDAPPPGTAFDADALWGDLDRRLRPRRRFTGWWVAAGGLLALLAGLGAWVLFSAEKTATPTRQFATGKVRPKPERLAAAPTVRAAEVATRAERRIVSAKPTVTAKAAPRRAAKPVAEPAPSLPETAPVTPTAPEASPQPVAESVVAVVKPVFSEKKKARAQPRFRIVHANELPSNETIPTKQPRTEATARVTFGYPSALQPAPAETPHVLMLNRKHD